MRRTVILLSALTLLAATSCTIHITDSPMYGETIHSPLVEGAYSRRDGGFMYMLTIEDRGDGHEDGALATLDVYMSSALAQGQWDVHVGTFSGVLEHVRTVHHNTSDGSEEVHRDRLLFTRYEGQAFRYGCRDMSAVVEIRHRDGMDIGGSDYGEHIVPALGSKTWLEDVSSASGYGGAVAGLWTRER